MSSEKLQDHIDSTKRISMNIIIVLSDYKTLHSAGIGNNWLNSTFTVVPMNVRKNKTKNNKKTQNSPKTTTVV